MPTLNHFFLDTATNQPSGAALRQQGPRLQVEVSIHPTLAQHLQTQNQPVPAPAVGWALIDTGATLSCVDDSVIQQLHIQPVGIIQIGTAGGPQNQAQYPAQFSFPGTPFPQMNFSTVIGVHLTGQGIIALIGRDVLQHFVMIYNGGLGQVILSF